MFSRQASFQMSKLLKRTVFAEERIAGSVHLLVIFSTEVEGYDQGTDVFSEPTLKFFQDDF